MFINFYSEVVHQTIDAVDSQMTFKVRKQNAAFQILQLQFFAVNLVYQKVFARIILKNQCITVGNAVSEGFPRA